MDLSFGTWHLRRCIDMGWLWTFPHARIFDFEVGGHDGAYKCRVHVIVPFIGRKNDTLLAWQQSYNDVHGWYRARIEQPFAHLWHWGLIRNIWCGGPNELYQSVCILLHFTQFCIRRQVRYPPYGPWEHVPPHVRKSTEATVVDDTQNDVGDEVDICALCCQKHTTTECGECHLHYCVECIDPHTCGDKTIYSSVLLVQFERTNLVEQSCEGDSDMLFLFNVVHGWFVASFGRQEAAIGLLGSSIR